jgi:hypothetical protein
MNHTQHHFHHASFSFPIPFLPFLFHDFSLKIPAYLSHIFQPQSKLKEKPKLGIFSNKNPRASQFTTKPKVENFSKVYLMTLAGLDDGISVKMLFFKSRSISMHEKINLP